MALPVSSRAELVGEDLHVAGQHGELDVVLRHQGPAARPRPRTLVSGGDRDVVERDAVELGQAREVPVVGHDGRDLDRQGAGALQEQQVVEAVRRGAGHQQGADLPAGRVEAPLHAEGLRHGLQRRLQLGLGRRRRRLHPHEEGAGALAAVLLGVRNIAARHEEGAGDGVHDARAGPGRKGSGCRRQSAGRQSRGTAYPRFRGSFERVLVVLTRRNWRWVANHQGAALTKTTDRTPGPRVMSCRLAASPLPPRCWHPRGVPAAAVAARCHGARNQGAAQRASR